MGAAKAVKIRTRTRNALSGYFEKIRNYSKVSKSWPSWSMCPDRYASGLGT